MYSRQTTQPIVTLPVPDTLRHGTGGVKTFFNRVAGLPLIWRYVFEMGGVTFIEPCGVIALLSAVRHCAAQSGARVLIKNLNEQLYPYLHRMNLFQVAVTLPGWSAPRRTSGPGADATALIGPFQNTHCYDRCYHMIQLKCASSAGRAAARPVQAHFRPMVIGVLR